MYRLPLPFLLLVSVALAQPQGPPPRVSIEALNHGAVPRGSVGQAPEHPSMDRGDAEAFAMRHVGALSGGLEMGCSPATLAALSGAAFVTGVANAGWSCLDQLWSFDATVGTVIGSANVSAVAADISASTPGLPGTALRVEKLSYFLQIAYYHEFYQSAVSYPAATWTASQQAMMDVAGSPQLFGTGSALLDLRVQWSITTDSTLSSPQVLGPIEAVLNRFRTTPSLAGTYGERVTVYYCMSGMARQIGNTQSQGASGPWWGIIPATLTAELTAYALDTGYPSATEYLVLNAIWTLAQFSFLDSTPANAAHAALTSAYNVHLTYSAPWLRAVQDLDSFWGGQLAGGGMLDIAAIQQAVMAIALPNTYTLDQGRRIYRTAISLADAHKLDDALKEVDAQFFRKSGYLDPVPGDQNEVLTMVIYGSPDEYDLYQPFLFNLPTNNGGIYIEGDGTFYTYDRTPQQSIYTLEELTRHEYTHYLDARWLVTGGFYGSGTLYTGGRIDWYGEGLAEYMAGARRTAGVLPRGVLIDRIANDSVRLTVPQIVTATYSQGFTFYRYAGSFFAFLDDQRDDLLRVLFDRVRGNDIGQYDSFIASLASDAPLQAAFTAWLDARIAERQAGTGTFAENVSTVYRPATLPADNAAAVLQTLDTQIAGVRTGFRVWDDRFHWAGTLSISENGDPLHVLGQRFEAALDARLGALTPLLANFASATASFGDLSVTGPTATATIAFVGTYDATSADITPPSAPTGAIASGSMGGVAIDWDDAAEPDIASYDVWRGPAVSGPFTQINTLPVLASSWVDANPGGGGTSFYVVTANDASGNGSPNSNVTAASSPVRILIVNGYYAAGNTGYVNAYKDALDAIGWAYDVHDPFTQGEVTAAVLAPYVDGVVIWAVGYYHSSYPTQFSAARQATVEGYLSAGGNLVFSGSYKSVYLGGSNLYSSFFNANYVQHTVDLEDVAMSPSGRLGLSNTLTLPYGGTYTCELDVTSSAVAEGTYVPGTGSGSINSSGTGIFTVENGYKVTFLAFPFSHVDSGSRTTLLDTMMLWMMPPPRPQVVVSPVAAGVVNTALILDADVGGQAWVLVGTQPGSIPAPCVSNHMIGIADFVLLPPLPTPQGQTSFDYFIPSVVAGQTFLLQVGVLPSCRASEVLSLTF